MKRININQIELPLVLISFTFLTLWLVGALYVLLSPLEEVSLLSFKEAQPIYIFLMYMFSMVIPSAGLLIFMNKNKQISSRWYWGIPFLLAIILLTFVRDDMYMSMFYEISFISSYDSSGIFESRTIRALIRVFFSFASLLFILSVPENKKELMKMPFIVAIIIAVSISIYYLVYLPTNNTIDSLYYLSILGSFLLGLLLLRVSVHYNTEESIFKNTLEKSDVME